MSESQRALLHVDNWTPGLTPCVLVGFEHALPWDSVVDDDGLVQLHIQAGGYSCLHYDAFGYVLRLSASQPFAHADVAPIVRGFAAISESGYSGPGAVEVPLDVPTRGENLIDVDLRELDATLAQAWRLPKLERGVEAFVHFEVVALLSYFRGWPVWRLDPTIADAPIVVDDATIGSFVAHDQDAFDAEHVAHLVAVARAAGIDQPPRAHLVWENSD